MAAATNLGAARALLLMRILRAGILLLCVAGAGAAWMFGSATAIGLALVILAEEMWECSVVVAALRRASHGDAITSGTSGWSAPSLPRHRS